MGRGAQQDWLQPPEKGSLGRMRWVQKRATPSLPPQEQHWGLKYGDSTRLCQHSAHGPAPGTGPTSTTGGRKALQLPWAQVGWLWLSSSGWVRGECGRESMVRPGEGGSRPFQPCSWLAASKGQVPPSLLLPRANKQVTTASSGFSWAPRHIFPFQKLSWTPALLLLTPSPGWEPAQLLPKLMSAHGNKSRHHQPPANNKLLPFTCK